MGADIRARQAREEAQKRESTDAMGGRNAREPTARGRPPSPVPARAMGTPGRSLYAKARRRHIEGHSKMTKRQLENAPGLRER